MKMSKDLFQPLYQYNVQQVLSQKIKEQFPDFSPSVVNILARAIVNKLCEGVEYPSHLEKKIKKIYPIIFK
jgi:hypothetical protein